MFPIYRLNEILHAKMEVSRGVILVIATIAGTFIGVEADTMNDCEVIEQRIYCHGIPPNIPSQIREVFLQDIDIENDAMDFDSNAWEHVNKLDIQSTVGNFFRKRHQPLFRNIPNLKYIGIHSHKLRTIDMEYFTDLPKVHTLDLSNCLMLNISEVINAFTLNSSLINLQNIILSSIYTAHRHYSTSLEKDFFEFLQLRPLKTLGLNGMKFSYIDYISMRLLCNSLEILNISNIVYVPEGLAYIRHLAPCPSLKIVDMSQTDARYLALRYLAYRLETSKDTDKLKTGIAFEGFPSLEALHFNSLDFGFSGIEFTFTSGSLDCKECAHGGNVRNLFIRNNKIKWLNISCASCNQLKLQLIDLSGNGLQYISPEFLGHIVTLEDIRLDENKLHVMETHVEFEELFATFLELRRVTISGNGLSRLPNNMFKGNLKLELIDLSNNKLTALPGSLYKLAKLLWLDISQNNIHVLTPEPFASFSSFVENKLNALGTKFHLNISNNPYSCSCKGSQLIKWLYVYLLPRLPQVPSLVCELENHDEVIIDDTAMLRSQHLCEKTSSTTAASVLSICLSLVTIITVILIRIYLLRRKRNRLREEFIKIFKVNRNKLSKYLFFLIFCQKEEGLIRERILPVLSKYFADLLETEENIVCVGYNQYKLGLTIFNEMERCLRHSAVVIYLQSTVTSQCKRCKKEFEMVLEKEKPLALITEGDVDTSLLSPLMTMALNKAPMITYADLNDRNKSDRFCKIVLDLVIGESL